MRRWISTHPAKAGTLAAWAVQCGTFLVQLALVPFLLHHIGAHRMGEWFYLLGASLFLQVGDFGFSQTAARQISYLLRAQRGQAERHGFFLRLPGPRGLAAVLAAHRWLAYWGALATVGTGIAMDALLLFHGEFRRTPDLAVCWYALVMATIVSCITRVQATFLSGVLRPYDERFGFGVGLAIQYACTFLGVLLWPSVATLGAAALIGALAQGACWNWLASDRPEARPARRAIAARLWRLCAPQGAATLSASVAFQSNPILLGQIAGAHAVAMLALPTRIATVAIDALRAMFVPQIGFIGKDIGAHDARAVLVRIYRNFAALAVATVGGFTLFALAGPAFIHWWARGQLDPPFVVFLLLAALHAIVCLENLAGFVTAHGVMPFAVVGWLAALSNLGLMFLLIPRFGLAGSVASTLVAQVTFSTSYTFVLLRRRLKFWHAQDPGFSWRDLLPSGEAPTTPGDPP
jgi:O-antigen/teichoic acid export membrane protein